MQRKFRLPFSNLTLNNWQNLIIFAIIVFYTISLGYAIGKGPIQSGFGGDYLAFWSAGKIADEKGYAQIYDLEQLRSVQFQELEKLGLSGKFKPSNYSPFPVAFLPIFVIPFQILSKIKFELSFWIWKFINLTVLIGYLIHFTKRITPKNLEKVSENKLLLLMLISYPVWINLSEGQINILLVVCTGEFLSQAIWKKPVLSGLWLGGLLLKPQLLILIIPVLLLMRNWKVLLGFIASSFILLMTSFILSGYTGMMALVNLWIRFSAGIATSAPERMINWRMIGVNINSLFGTSLGWVIVGLGIVLTMLAITKVLKRKTSFGSSRWVTTMMAVMSATLAVTWHAHYHMAVVLIPFLVYSSQFKLLPAKVIFSWATLTIILFISLRMIAVIIFFISKIVFLGIEYWVAISGFYLNLVLLLCTLRYLYAKQNVPEILYVDNPIA